MIRIKIFSDFCGSKGAKEVYERLCDAENLDFYGKDKQVWITEDDDYTHAIIMNKAMPILKIPKKNVVGLAFEPFEILRITQSGSLRERKMLKPQKLATVVCSI